MSRQFFIRFLSLIVLALFAWSSAGCAPQISRQDLLDQIQGASPPLIIDVRTAKEFKGGHVPGAVNISIFDDFRARFEMLDPPKDRPIVVICEHGPRSSFAGFVLKLSGYENVRELGGAMKEWKKSGSPMER